jgi:hypothetical protein
MHKVEVEDLKPWLILLRAFMDTDTEMTEDGNIVKEGSLMTGINIRLLSTTL